MSNIAKLEFATLDINVKMHLESMRISNTEYEFDNCLTQHKEKSQVFPRKNIDEMLRFEYLDIIDPNKWRTLKFQDFEKVNEYNSSLFKICSELKYCGQEVTDEDMLEKTYSTFHAININLM
uniref:Uncharacterized protein n=1 Tax=Lactuca sativa TaxID=4236 RepID=A0A9R1VHL7_LACSA|nr:hypothetical protein LSAT_V11C500252510 [Lactuca sativa]